MVLREEVVRFDAKPSLTQNRLSADTHLCSDNTDVCYCGLSPDPDSRRAVRKMPPKKAAAKGKGKRRKDESEDESDFEVSDGSDEEFVETQPAKKCRGEGKGKGKNGGGRGRSGASGSGSGKKAPVDVLVGRLARADLEKLVLRSIQENAPPTLKDIEACLEPDKVGGFTAAAPCTCMSGVAFVPASAVPLSLPVSQLGKYELVFRNVEGKESLVEEGPFQVSLITELDVQSAVGPHSPTVCLLAEAWAFPAHAASRQGAHHPHPGPAEPA